MTDRAHVRGKARFGNWNALSNDSIKIMSTLTDGQNIWDKSVLEECLIHKN